MFCSVKGSKSVMLQNPLFFNVGSFLRLGAGGGGGSGGEINN